MSNPVIFQTRKQVITQLSDPVTKLANTHKTEMCKFVMSRVECPYGEYCDYAHSEQELRRPICLFNQKGVCINDKCSFSHDQTNLPLRNYKPIMPTYIPVLTEQQQRTQICERLYKKVNQEYPQYAEFTGKIVGMFYELDNFEELVLINNYQNIFEERVKEGYSLIMEYLQSQRDVTESPTPEKAKLITEPEEFTNQFNEKEEELESLIEDIETMRLVETPIGTFVPLHASPVQTLERCGVVYSLYHKQEIDLDSNEEDRQLRGIICKNNIVVCRSFAHTIEINVDSKYFDRFVPAHFNKSIIVDSLEGTMIRVWFDNDSWNLSTFRKIDAYNSRFNSKKTFGVMFHECLQTLNIAPSKFYSSLDKNKVYAFLITNDMTNRMVCRNPIQSIYSMGSFDKANGFAYTQIESESGLSLPTSYKIESIAELKEKVESIDSSKQIGLCMLSSDGVIVKIVNKKYEELSKVRGEASNVLVRYLEVRGQRINHQPSADEIKLRELHADKCAEFDRLESDLKSCARKLYTMYKQVFFDKIRIPLDGLHYKFLCDVQEWTLNNNVKKSEFNLHDHIWGMIDRTDKSTIYYIVDRFKSQQKINEIPITTAGSKQRPREEKNAIRRARK